MKVCIAEKPSVAAEIARVLGANARHDGYYSSGDYCVTWSFGHLCELKEPDDYDPILKQWRFELLPIIPQHFDIKLKNDKGVRKQFNTIANLFKNAEAIINCGDAGQEGELIQRWIMQLANASCPVYRLWISSLTEESIREGFANLRPGSEFDSLFAAGSARAIGDWMLGMNATRAYSLRYGGRGMVLSVGRVQTPTLGLIVQRYKEIANFKPENYWELKTKYRDVVFSATSGRFADVESGNKALQEVSAFPFVVEDVKSKQGKESAPALFDLTSLQVECNNKFGFTAEETLRIAQYLYENKFTTYPRVDTKFLTDDIYAKVPGILRGLSPYANFTAPLLAMPKLPKPKRVFNNVKVTDHHAIIPTGTPPISSMHINEKKVYDLIARRFIANFYPDSTVLQTTVLGAAGSVKFKVNGKQIVDPGWRTLYGNSQVSTDNKDEAAVSVLPEFKVGEQGPHQPALQEKQTQPPKPYTEATLLRAMETAGKQVDDEELRTLMKENGIGRPSTRAAIIETLYRRKYIVKEKKNLQPSVVGIQLIDTIKTSILKSVELTGQWERKLRLIEDGKFTTEQFIDEMRSMVTEVIASVGNDVSAQRFQAPTVASPKPTKERASKSSKGSSEPKNSDTGSAELTCPRCGRPFVKGKSAWGCSGYREGCQTLVPFEVMGKKLTEAQLSSLLKKGVTPNIKGLVVNGEKAEGKLSFDSNFAIIFNPKEAKEPKSSASSVDISQLRCPLCGGAVLQGRTAWGCEGYKTGCTFRVPFVFFSKKLTPTHLKVLVTKRKTGTMDGFVDENGVNRKGAIILLDNGQPALQNS